MKYGYKNIKAFIVIWMLTLGLTLSTGCSDDYSSARPEHGGHVSLQIDLSIPGPQLGGTRNTDIYQEAGIDYATLQVLVFEETATGDIFRYKVTPEGNASPFRVKVPVSRIGEKYRFVLLANTPPQIIAEGAGKEETLRQFLIKLDGRWNTSAASATSIPMWGESSEAFVLRNDKHLTVVMHRALARVDVGNRFIFNDAAAGEDITKEKVLGLDSFKIKEIRLYRTLGELYPASSAGRMQGNEVTLPNIPASALFNSEEGTQYRTLEEADRFPLVYTLQEASDRCLREIYIPESSLIEASSNSGNVPCLVVGGYYGEENTSDVTYYRADFANYANGVVDSYFPILRNHRYVFDIKSVNGPGFETPEQALHSIMSDLKLQVIHWNEVAQDYYLQGDYYFLIHEREVWLEGGASTATSGNYYRVPYQTDLELDGTAGKSFRYVWSSSGNRESPYFDLEIDYAGKMLIFKAKTDNLYQQGTLSEVLSLEVENLQLTIDVHQKEMKPNYALSCQEVRVAGKYREGMPLDNSHYMTVTVITEGGSLDGLGYEIKTIEKNGIYFNGKGRFDVSQATPLNGESYAYTLRLDGFGTPVNEMAGKVLTSFDVTLVSNSVNDAFCSARIVVAYKRKRILTIGANASYLFGYMLEPYSASRAFMDATVNFGLAANSTVSMEKSEPGSAFTIEVMTVSQGMAGEEIVYAELVKKLNEFKPDIILTGQAINYFSLNGNTIGLLADFVNNGGVFIMCNEYYPVAKSIEAMVQKIMGPEVTGNDTATGSDQPYRLNGNDDDPILNGPFGNMQGKQWGADGSRMFGFTNLRPEEVIVYSTRPDGYANMFRHRSKPFFFVGDGGFISNNRRYIGNDYVDIYYYPFAIDGSYRPIPRINFSSQRKTVYNSQIFGNIIAWAIDYSENN